MPTGANGVPLVAGRAAGQPRLRHYSTFGAAIAADLGVPFVQVVHNTYVWLGERAIDDYRAADAATTGYICVSAEVARYCDRRMGLDVNKMIVVPNGVDLHQLDAARFHEPERLRGELGIAAEDFVFLNVGSIHATKAQATLLLALARVVERRPGVRLVIAGPVSADEYAGRLRRRIGELDLRRNVVLAGQRADVARFYWMADAFVLPSLWEGWSLALTEAACAGLPLVATAVGGAADVVQGGDGRLVRPPFNSICDVDFEGAASVDPRRGSAVHRRAGRGHERGRGIAPAPAVAGTGTAEPERGTHDRRPLPDPRVVPPGRRGERGPRLEPGGSTRSQLGLTTPANCRKAVYKPLVKAVDGRS